MALASTSGSKGGRLSQLHPKVASEFFQSEQCRSNVPVSGKSTDVPVELSIFLSPPIQLLPFPAKTTDENVGAQLVPHVVRLYRDHDRLRAAGAPSVATFAVL